MLLESKKDEKQYFYIHLQRSIFNVLFLYDNKIVNMYVCVSKILFFLILVLVNFLENGAVVTVASVVTIVNCPAVVWMTFAATAFY